MDTHSSPTTTEPNSLDDQTTELTAQAREGDLFSEAQRAAFIRATELLTEFAGSFSDWPIQTGVRPCRCAWPPPNNVGLRIPGSAALLTVEVMRWFLQRGWIASTFAEDVIVAPLVEVVAPDRCYHTTPAVNEDGINQRGLLRGADAGR